MPKSERRWIDQQDRRPPFPGESLPLQEVNHAHPDKMFVSVNGRMYSLQELVTQAEAFQYLLKTPSKLEVFANTAHVNFVHHAPWGPLPELTESTLVSIAKIHGIERGTPEYTLLYIIQEYFAGVVANKQKVETTLPRERQPTPSSDLTPTP